jgi:hypothetical protein
VGLTAMAVKNSVLWNIMPYSLVKADVLEEHSTPMYSFKYGGDVFLQNIDLHLTTHRCITKNRTIRNTVTIIKTKEQ